MSPQGDHTPGWEPVAPRGISQHHGRVVERLRECLGILERQQVAIAAGRSRHVRELGRLESEATGEIASLERALGALERRMPETVALARLQAERATLRAAVLERNRRNRELIAAQLLETRRRIVARRIRLGTPSPYAELGQASIVDLTT